MFGLAEDLLITPLKKKIRVEVMALTIRSFTGHLTNRVEST